MNSSYTRGSFCERSKASASITTTARSSLPESLDGGTNLLGIDPFQVGDVNLTAAGSFQADSQLDANRGAIVGERDQQVEIRVGILVAPRQRAIEHGKTNALLSPQRPAKTGEKRPMSAEILTLTRRKPGA